MFWLLSTGQNDTLDISLLFLYCGGTLRRYYSYTRAAFVYWSEWHSWHVTTISLLRWNTEVVLQLCQDCFCLLVRMVLLTFHYYFFTAMELWGGITVTPGLLLSTGQNGTLDISLLFLYCGGTLRRYYSYTRTAFVYCQNGTLDISLLFLHCGGTLRRYYSYTRTAFVYCQNDTLDISLLFLYCGGTLRRYYS